MIRNILPNFAPARTTRRRFHRRGMIFVTALWIILALLAMALIFAREMRVEVMASANRIATDQASTLELGGEQYVLAGVDACNGDAVTVLQTPAEQIQIPGSTDQSGRTSGGGYFWIIQAYNDQDVTPTGTAAFGITDESSKLNLNVATSTALATLPSPNMTQAIADSIVLWHGGASTATTGQGADTSYYQTLPRPYAAKGANFESVDELYLVRDVTDSLLYGYDYDHNGTLDTIEQSGGGLANSFNSVNGTGRGIFPFVTVWSQEPNTDSTGKARINISMIQSPTQLRTVLGKTLPAARVTQIVERAMQMRTFKSLFDFAAKTQMQPAELAQVADELTTSPAKTLPGLININTAPQQVLMCLPNLTTEDALAIITQRENNGIGNNNESSGAFSTGTNNTAANTDYTWVLGVTSLTPAKLATMGNLITGRSFFYSADIVAVTSNGGAFKRARIVVDASKSPPVIVYRKDLTYLGWPLDPAILTTLKSGKGLTAGSGYGTGGANGLTQIQ